MESWKLLKKVGPGCLARRRRTGLIAALRLGIILVMLRRTFCFVLFRWWDELRMEDVQELECNATNNSLNEEARDEMAEQN
jgi:hypothetical protein